MSVNFYKNRDPMVAAYKQVIDEKSNINWALFGYEKQTNDLTLIDKGDGGLEQLFDEFNSSKILYAFCRVTDPDTELTKYVIVNWQGEGAPLQRKGVCFNHFRDVCDFFKGAHLTIHARTEDEVEPQVILNQIARISAKVNLKDRLDISENMSPVGSNYKRVQPQREISQTEREKFWNRSQEEEKLRQIEEKKRLNENRAKMEKEREEREMREAKQRDTQIKEREETILKQREYERNAVNAMKSENKINLTDDRINDDNERRLRSEQMRRQRVEEAKAAVSQSSIRSARAIFEQNSSAGQMNSAKSSSQSKSSLISNRKQMFEANDNQPNITAQVGNKSSQPSVNQARKLWEQQPEVNGKHSTAEPEKQTAPVSTYVAAPVSTYVAAPVAAQPPVVEAAPVRSPSPVSSPSPVTAPARSPSPVTAPARSPSPVTAPARSPSPIQNIEKFEAQNNSIDESCERTLNGQNGQNEENGANFTEPTDVVYARNLMQETYLQETHPLEDIAEEQSWDDPSNPPEEQYDSTANVYDDQTEAIPTDIGLKKARALFDYQAADETEISFDPDDIITHIEQIDAGWWQGLAPDGTYGLFPANYVELID